VACWPLSPLCLPFSSSFLARAWKEARKEMASGSVGMVSIIRWLSAVQVDRVNVPSFMVSFLYAVYWLNGHSCNYQYISLLHNAKYCLLYLAICLVQLKWYHHGVPGPLEKDSCTHSLRCCFS